MKFAKQDTYGVDGVGVRRFIRAGDPIPPGLDVVDSSDMLDRDPAAPAAPPVPAVEEPVVEETVNYDEVHVDELERLAREREIYDSIKGTGKDDNVIKPDLVAALKAAGDE